MSDKNIYQILESLDAAQRGVKQLPALFKPRDTSPQLSGPYPGRNATLGYLVGEGDETGWGSETGDSGADSTPDGVSPDTQSFLDEEEQDNPMRQAVTRRIVNQHPEWITRYGVEFLMQVIDDVTEDETDWEEIGSSDVSAFVNMVGDQLRDRGGSREEMRDRRPFAEQGPTGTDKEKYNELVAALNAARNSGNMAQAKQIGDELIKLGGGKFDIDIHGQAKPVAEDGPRYKFQRIKFRGTDHDIGEERYRFVIDGNPIVFNFPSDEDDPDPDSPSFEEILAKVQRSGEVRHYRITPAEQQAIAKKIAAERRRYLDQRRHQGLDEQNIDTRWSDKMKSEFPTQREFDNGMDRLQSYIVKLSLSKIPRADLIKKYFIQAQNNLNVGWPDFPESYAKGYYTNLRAGSDLMNVHGIAEGHADQQRKIIKKAGKPVGEIGIDRESSPGGGQYYMKHYASGTDLSGYDSFEEAMDELRYAVKQGVAEAESDRTYYRVGQHLLRTQGNLHQASEDEILAAAGDALEHMDFSDTQIRSIMRDPDFQSDVIEFVRRGPVTESATTEDVLSSMKKKLGDYLSDLSKEIKKDPDLKDRIPTDIDQIKAIKTITTDDGHEIKITGNEDDGFRISIKNREAKTKFRDLDEATMAVEMFCARRRNQDRDYLEER